jgi:hypothetical protein
VGYWDIGVRGDTGPTNHDSTFTLAPSYSILTSTTGYNAAAAHNAQDNPNLASQYCNGSRVPPENGGMGYAVPPGISDATVPNPIFNLTPAATVDEGNNWINMTYGPLSLSNPTMLPYTPLTAPAGTTATNYGNYELTGTSADAIGAIPSGTQQYTDAPQFDLFGNSRKTNAKVDIGAVEYTGSTGGGGGTTSLAFSPTTWTPSHARNCPGTGLGILACAADGNQGFILTNTGTTTVTAVAQGVLGGANAADFTIVRALSNCGPNGNGQLLGPRITLAPGATCTVTVGFRPLTAEAAGAKTATVSVTDSAGTQSVTINATAN